MEFRLRAGEQRPSSFLPPVRAVATSASFAADGYFRKQALRAGFLGLAGDVVRALPISLMGPPQRAIEKERIREEICLREMVERRILEEEVRRELEMERLMAMRRFQTESFQEQSMMFSFASEPRIRNGHGPRLLPAAPELGFDEVRALGTQPTIMKDKSSPLPAQKLDHLSSDSALHPEMQPSNKKVSGTKRKAAENAASNKALSLVQKNWSCALCQVSATSEMALNDHLQGKKHRAKVAALDSKKTGAKMNDGNISSKPKMAVRSNKGGPTNVLKFMKIHVDGKIHQVLKKGFSLWCERCKVTCNSSTMMATHLVGKKHNALMEPEKDPSPAGATVGICDRGLMQENLAVETASKDVVADKEESIVKKEEDKLPNSTEQLEKPKQLSVNPELLVPAVENSVLGGSTCLYH